MSLALPIGKPGCPPDGEPAEPPSGLLGGGVGFSSPFVVIFGERGPSPDATRQSGAAVLAVGRAISAVAKFVIVSSALLWLVRLIHRLHAAPGGDEALMREKGLQAEVREDLRPACGALSHAGGGAELFGLRGSAA